MKYCRFLLVLGLIAGAVNAKTARAEDQALKFVNTYKSSSPVVARPKAYDQAPTVIEEDGKYKIWYCGGGQPGDPYRGHDSIFYTELDKTGKTLRSPERVLTPGMTDASEEGDHACAVTVVKQSHPAIEDGKELYKMYYECAPRVYSKATSYRMGCYTQICHAVSDDGINWRKFNYDLLSKTGKLYGDTNTNPSAVIGLGMTFPGSTVKAGGSIKENVKLTVDVSGKRWVDIPSWKNEQGVDLNYCGDPGLNYGTGHPTAIVVNNQIWMWYYDSQGNWNERGLYLAKSWDGFHFENVVKTNMQSGLKVKYIDRTDGRDFFLGVGAPFHINVFNYSWDGINWFWQDQGRVDFYTDYLKSNFNLGSATECPVGALGVNGNKYGTAQNDDLAIFTVDGFFGPTDGCTETNGCKCYSRDEDFAYGGDRGNSMEMYMMRGKFETIPQRKLGDANGDGKTDLNDFGIWKKEYLGQLTTKTADFNGDGKIGLDDFGAWKKTYLGM